MLGPPTNKNKTNNCNSRQNGKHRRSLFECGPRWPCGLGPRQPRRTAAVAAGGADAVHRPAALLQVVSGVRRHRPRARPGRGTRGGTRPSGVSSRRSGAPSRSCGRPWAWRSVCWRGTRRRCAAGTLTSRTPTATTKAMTATTTATTGATAAAWAWAAQTRAQRRARDASTSSLACAAAARTACPTAASVTSLSPAARRTHERELLRYDLGELCAQLRARGGVGVAAADDALPTFEHVAALPPNGHLGPGGRLCPPANYAYTGTERRSPLPTSSGWPRRAPTSGRSTHDKCIVGTECSSDDVFNPSYAF